MVLPVGIVYQDLLRITKIDDQHFVEENILPVRFVPLVKEDES
jgi:protein-L-isoaspartate O-methyltransferase